MNICHSFLCHNDTSFLSPLLLPGISIGPTILGLVYTIGWVAAETSNAQHSVYSSHPQRKYHYGFPQRVIMDTYRQFVSISSVLRRHHSQHTIQMVTGVRIAKALKQTTNLHGTNGSFLCQIDDRRHHSLIQMGFISYRDPDVSAPACLSIYLK